VNYQTELMVSGSTTLPHDSIVWFHYQAESLIYFNLMPRIRLIDIKTDGALTAMC
jgi:hypothetical protein